MTLHGPDPHTAYPSIAARSTGGTRAGETSGVASTQPTASASGRLRGSSGVAVACASSRAASHDNAAAA
jgi:hypothetical protein